MWIRSVTAQAFGPLQDQTLALAEGLTVVVGDNESAKSSWHAATYAALCGRRRARGKPKTDDAEFAAAHRPWAGTRWLVTAEILLDDGRRIEMKQDLAGNVDCHALDLDLNRDLSADVMFDGTPDASLWLGLDRESFLATACVEQAQILQVLSRAGGLQQHLQRAAASAGTDATAAAALQALDEFVKERVGLERVNSSRPLQTALNRVRAAEATLRQRSEQHLRYLSLVDEAEDLRVVANRLDWLVRLREAAAAEGAARSAEDRARKAAELTNRFPGGAPSPVEDDELAQRATRALAAWQALGGAPTAHSAASAAQLRAELDALPSVPDGDREPHRSVVDALEAVTRSAAQLEAHDGARPEDASPVASPSTQVSDDELVALAAALEAPSRGAHAAPDLTGTPRIRLAAIGVAIVGLMTAIAGAASHVWLLAGMGGLLTIAGGVLALRKPSATAQAVDAPAAREQARQRCARVGLAPDPTALRAIVVARAEAAARAGLMQRWQVQQQRLYAEAASADSALAAALAGRGMPRPATLNRTDLIRAAEQYGEQCRARATAAVAASRAADLEAQWSAAAAAEQRAGQDERTRVEAISGLRAVARECGLADDAPAVLADRVTDWLDRRRERVRQQSADLADWAQLTSLLDGSTVAELNTQAATARARATRLTAVFSDTELNNVPALLSDDEATGLRDEASAALERAATAEGNAQRFADGVGSVAEAEEELAAAQAELGRVRSLQQVLGTTRQFLSAAQERVHRDIAPVLAASVSERLPALTAGRYTKAIVDPTSLAVRVSDASGNWRDASMLSFGTAEQVYLLLRVALVDHLTAGHDTCPLLLDDVTVHADAIRTDQVMEQLWQVAQTRQVVLFTQQAQVAQWAESRLADSARDAVVRLSPVPV